MKMIDTEDHYRPVVYGLETRASDLPNLAGFISATQVGPMRPALLSIVVPAYCERDNISELVNRVAMSLGDTAWEMIVVDDDSPDGTALAARKIYSRDPRVRVIRRIGRRGLASACIEGMLSTSAPFIAVMDADLQHDPDLLRAMLSVMQANLCDVAVASRFIEGGSIGQWDRRRARLSDLATGIARRMTDVELSDPMSGYFMLRREIIDQHAAELSGFGFKILLDIVLTCPLLRVIELPLVFGVRRAGTSKLSASVLWDYGLLLADKAFGKIIPVRFFAFIVVGLAGVLIHFLTLGALFEWAALPFVTAQIGATAAAIICNFAINNLLTYSDRSLSGWRWARGLLSFAAICGVGATANIGVAAYLFGHHATWPVAAFAGIAASAVWNYAVSARYTWGAMR